MPNTIINLTSNFLEKYPPEYYTGFIFIVLALYIIRNSLKYGIDFYKFYENRKNEKLKQLIEIQELNKNPQMDSVIKDKIDALIFCQCSGFLPNKEEREVILRLKEEYNIEIIHFRRAYKLYKIHNGQLDVRITSWDRIEKYTVYILSFFAFLSGILTIFITILGKLNWLDISLLYTLSIIFIFAGAIILTQNWKFTSAKIIQEKLTEKK